MATAIFEVRGRLLELLNSEFAEPGATVDYGPPRWADPLEVRIRGSVVSDEAPAALGAGRRRETFDTTVDVSVWDASGSDPQAVHDLAAQALDRLGVALDGAGTLDGLLDMPLSVAATEMPDGVLPGERSGLGLLTTLTIRAQARTLPRD
jgi:hypothetical protein